MEHKMEHVEDKTYLNDDDLQRIHLIALSVRLEQGCSWRDAMAVAILEYQQPRGGMSATMTHYGYVENADGRRVHVSLSREDHGRHLIVLDDRAPTEAETARPKALAPRRRLKVRTGRPPEE